MQLMWLSGPTAKVVTLSVGRKTIVAALAAAALLLVVLGGILQLLGIRIAIDTHPGLARTLGGVTSTGEQARIAQQYEAQIARLREKVEGLAGKVDKLESTKRALVQLVPSPSPPRWGVGGVGGPWRRLVDSDWFAPKAVDGLQKLSGESERLDQHIQQLDADWAAELNIVRLLPLQPPVRVEHQVSSGFGVRFDPFNHSLSRHEGLDFVAPHGAPIHATAAGVVLLAEPFGAYGLAVDIDHGQGFSTRYAHLSHIDVVKGEQVAAGQPIGRLGSTGRSTGPHLHYEVRVNGQPIPPLTDAVLKQASEQVRSGQLPLPTTHPKE